MTGHSVAELVEAAVGGDQQAWNRIVERYLPLVSSVVSKYRLSDDDTQDVSQTLWLRLVEHLGDIREPRALPAWIVTTTRNEALRLLATRKRTLCVDPQVGSELEGEPDRSELDDHLLREERNQALREGMAELRPQHRELLVLLMTDPPMPYEQISRKLGIPIGSIGPTRARSLEQLRRTTAMRTLLTTDRHAESVR